jgi:pyrroloquinoline quinone biosynthesis protein D
MNDSIDRHSKPKLARKAKLQFDSVRSLTLLLLPERVVKLNKTAADILHLCDGKRAIEEITKELELRYSQAGLESEIIEFVRDVSRNGWVEK